MLCSYSRSPRIVLGPGGSSPLHSNSIPFAMLVLEYCSNPQMLDAAARV